MIKRINAFKDLKLGMFVHFGLYSIVGKGEWYMYNEKVENFEYDKLLGQFKVDKDWATSIISTAKSFGAKYIVLTTRHHDGFSLYDTHGLTDYDVMHTPTGRDLIKEFVLECRKNNIIPYFYHTIIDWHEKSFKKQPDLYFDYLLKSVKLLCKNYGEIGGFWFDGTWSDDDFDWHLDEIFSVIRKYQPQAIISNNGGWEHPGQVIHKEIDCIIYERVSSNTESEILDKKERAKEVCQTLNKHWGYCKNDKEYKTSKQLIDLFNECQQNNTNLLINVGPKSNGKVSFKDKCLLRKFGKHIKKKHLM